MDPGRSQTGGTRAPLDHFFQTDVWAEVRRSDGWESELVGGPWGSYRVLVRRLPVVRRTVVDVPYGPPGPYDDPAAVRELLLRLAAWARGIRAAVVRIHPFVLRPAGDPTLGRLRDEFQSQGFRPTSERLGYTHSYVVDLAPSEGELWNGFDGRMRGAVRKSDRAGVTVGDRSALGAFAVRYREMAARTGMRPESAAFFARLEVVALGSGHLQLLEAHIDDPAAIGRPPESGTLVGGLLLSTVGRAAVALWAHSVPEAGPVGANVRLHWEAMRWARRAGFALYDLGGFTQDAPEGSKKAGIHLFKKQFKAEMVELPGTHALVLAPGIARAARDLRRLKAGIAAFSGTLGAKRD